jgi:hypothetical protein
MRVVYGVDGVHLELESVMSLCGGRIPTKAGDAVSTVRRPRSWYAKSWEKTSQLC